MKVVLDTNVLLDHALNRQDTFADEASEIMELAETGRLQCGGGDRWLVVHGHLRTG